MPEKTQAESFKINLGFMVGVKSVAKEGNTLVLTLEEVNKCSIEDLNNNLQLFHNRYEELKEIGITYVAIRDIELGKMDPTFKELNLRRFKFMGVDLSGVDLSGTNLNEIYFVNCNLRGASFNKANLTGASFINCDMEGADLNSANCTGTNFKGSQVQKIKDNNPFAPWNAYQGNGIEDVLEAERQRHIINERHQRDAFLERKTSQKNTSPSPTVDVRDLEELRDSISEQRQTKLSLKHTIWQIDPSSAPTVVEVNANLEAHLATDLDKEIHVEQEEDKKIRNDFRMK